MSCQFCNNKGYQESSLLRDNSQYPMITKCTSPNCQYESNYYKEIKRRHSSEVPKDITRKKGIIEVHIPKEIIDKGSSNIIAEYLYNYLDTQIPLDLYSDRDLIVKATNTDIAIKSTIEDRLNTPGHRRPYQPLTRTPQSPTKTQQPGHSQVPHNATRPEVQMDTMYPNLPVALVDQAISILEQDPEATLSIETPLGIVVAKDLADANRIIGIINSYGEYSDELNVADDEPNVIIFPLGKAFGIK